jgi:hypothetical protein
MKPHDAVSLLQIPSPYQRPDADKLGKELGIDVLPIKQPPPRSAAREKPIEPTEEKLGKPTDKKLGGPTEEYPEEPTESPGEWSEEDLHLDFYRQ